MLFPKYGTNLGPKKLSSKQNLGLKEVIHETVHFVLFVELCIIGSAMNENLNESHWQGPVKFMYL